MEKFINHPMFDELINKGYTTEQKPDHPDYTDEGFCRDMWTIINESESDSPEVIAALKQHFAEAKAHIEQYIAEIRVAEVKAGFPAEHAHLIFKKGFEPWMEATYWRAHLRDIERSKARVRDDSSKKRAA